MVDKQTGGRMSVGMYISTFVFTSCPLATAAASIRQKQGAIKVHSAPVFTASS